ncbi:hypothetical protein [Nocardioides alcanivorans]|uniref:hypothetical protein n=1 Tax=Nocardioides alcanivorans TaxID=2897352 RepID=UPI001F46E97A|nr:hypothetical protein [Nocardioides alcanivorans]
MATPQDLARSVGLPDDGLDGLAALPQERLDSLTALVHAAVDREDALVATSLEAALNALPRPLRGRARALLLEES